MSVGARSRSGCFRARVEHDGETAGSAVRYETKTIQAVRGDVGRTITMWEQQGWEVVSRDDGALRSEIILRKAERTIDVRRYAVLGGAVAVVVGVVVAVSTVAGGGDDEPVAAAPTASSSARSTPAPSATAPPTTEPPSPSATADDVVTAENNPDFAAVLSSGEYCSTDIAAFAEQYRGRTVSFPASISALNPVAGTSTRYDIGIAPGNPGGESSTGPAFQFGDVNTTSDLNYTGTVPDSFAVGTLLDVTAEIGSYNFDQLVLPRPGGDQLPLRCASAGPAPIPSARWCGPRARRLRFRAQQRGSAPGRGSRAIEGCTAAQSSRRCAAEPTYAGGPHRFAGAGLRRRAGGQAVGIWDLRIPASTPLT